MAIYDETYLPPERRRPMKVVGMAELFAPLAQRMAARAEERRAQKAEALFQSQQDHQRYIELSHHLIDSVLHLGTTQRGQPLFTDEHIRIAGRFRKSHDRFLRNGHRDLGLLDNAEKKAERKIFNQYILPNVLKVLGHRMLPENLKRDVSELKRLRPEMSANRAYRREWVKLGSAILAAGAISIGLPALATNGFPNLAAKFADNVASATLTSGQPVSADLRPVVIDRSPLSEEEQRLTGNDANIDPAKLDDAFAELNQYKLAGAQGDLIRRGRELDAQIDGVQELLSSATTPEQQAALQKNLTKLQNQKAALPALKLNDKPATLVALKYAVIATHDADPEKRTKLPGSLGKRTPEERFAQLLAFARIESAFTPNVEVPDSPNRARGVLQLQPTAFFGAMASHIGEFVAHDSSGIYKPLLDTRNQIIDRYIAKHGVSFLNQKMQQARGVKDAKRRTVAVAQAAKMAADYKNDKTSLRNDVLADWQARNTAYGESTDAQKNVIASFIDDSRLISLNGEVTTAGAYISSVAALHLADQTPVFDRDMEAQFGHETLAYLSHQRGDGGMREFFGDYRNIVKRGKPADWAAYRAHSMGQARDNAGIWLAPPKTVVDKRGHSKTTRDLKSPEDVLYGIRDAYFGKLPEAGRTIAAAYVTPQLGMAAPTIMAAPHGTPTGSAQLAQHADGRVVFARLEPQSQRPNKLLAWLHPTPKSPS